MLEDLNLNCDSYGDTVIRSCLNFTTCSFTILKQNPILTGSHFNWTPDCCYYPGMYLIYIIGWSICITWGKASSDHRSKLDLSLENINEAATSLRYHEDVSQYLFGISTQRRVIFVLTNSHVAQIFKNCTTGPIPTTPGRQQTAKVLFLQKLAKIRTKIKTTKIY